MRLPLCPGQGRTEAPGLRAPLGAPAAAPQQPLPRAAAPVQVRCWETSGAGRVGWQERQKCFLFLYLRKEKIMETSWIPEIPHSPAAGHRTWSSVQSQSRPFKFQLCPQE